MSWYVEVLLINREIIQSKARQNLELEEYEDLLTVENTIENFKNSGLFSKVELLVLNYVIGESKIKPCLDRDTISKIFKRVCDRISYKLGNYFTDEGYLAYLAKKYDLPENKIRFIKTYMNSKFRYKLARKIYIEE